MLGILLLVIFLNDQLKVYLKLLLYVNKTQQISHNFLFWPASVAHRTYGYHITVPTVYIM